MRDVPPTQAASRPDQLRTVEAIVSAEFDDAFVQRFRSRIQDSDTASLVDSAREMRRQSETYRRCAAAAEDALYQRRGEATVMDGEDSVAEMEQGQTYEWAKVGMLLNTLDELHIEVPEAVITEIEPPREPTYKVNTRLALSFAKKRGLSALFERHYSTTKTAPRWVYSDRQKKEETS